MDDQRLLLRVDEAAAVLGISRSRAYELAAAGALPTIRIGRSRRVPARLLREWVHQQTVAHDERRADR